MAGFWKRLFAGPSKDRATSESTHERVDSIIAELKAQARPCLRLVPAAGGKSRLGGPAEMAVAWPRYEGRPLSLLAQLDLAEIHAAGGVDWLPSHGRLLFFYELEHSGWGGTSADAGCAVVRYETGAPIVAAEPADLPTDFRFDARPIRFSADTSLPDETRLNINWRSLSRAEEAALEQAIEALAPPEPVHQLGGFPAPIQDDQMELECQRAVSPSEGGARASDWRLLLQLDTDEEAGMMWGDTGRLYFWVREQDARAGDFSRTWTILQCF